MSDQIRQKVAQLTKISLQESDFLGRGQFSEVYLYQINNTQLAVKLFQDQSKAMEENQLFQSIESLASNCPGIIHYYGMKKMQIEILGDFGGNYQGYALFLNKCSVDLQKMITRAKQLPIKDVLSLLSQMSITLLCLHLNNCFHGDIKPANILVNKENQQLVYYLTDYGEGKIVSELIKTNHKTLSLRGTPFYFSPELWSIYDQKQISGNYNPLAADIYSLGIMIVELLTKQETILKLNIARLNQKQYQNELENVKKQLLQCREFKSAPALLNIILQMINFEPEKRPKAIEICQGMINSKVFSMDALDLNSSKALILQLLTAFNPSKKLLNNDQEQAKNLERSLEQQKTIIKNLEIEIKKLQEQNRTQNIEQMPKHWENKSNLLQNSLYLNIILALFEKENIQLVQLHQQLNITKLDTQQFHKDCDNQGPTLTIMHSNEEPNSFFGGMLASSLNSEGNNIYDPAEECSWLFKIEIKQNKVNLHKWQCINKQYAAFGRSDYGPYYGLGIGEGAGGADLYLVNLRLCFLL